MQILNQNIRDSMDNQYKHLHRFQDDHFKELFHTVAVYLRPQHPSDGAAIVEVDEEDGEHEDDHDARPAQAQDEQVGARPQRPEPGHGNIYCNIVTNIVLQTNVPIIESAAAAVLGT